jgi:hypothetical protein
MADAMLNGRPILNYRGGVCLVRCKVVVCCRIDLASRSHDLVTKGDVIFILGRFSLAQEEPDRATIGNTELCLQIVLRRSFPCKLKGLVGAPGDVRSRCSKYSFPLAWNFSSSWMQPLMNDRMNLNAPWKRLVGIFCDLPPGAEALDVRIQIILGRNDTGPSPYSFGSLQKLV